MTSTGWVTGSMARAGHLLMQQGLFAPTAHDAIADVDVLLLRSELPTGETVLAEATHRAGRPFHLRRAAMQTRHELKRSAIAGTRG